VELINERRRNCVASSRMTCRAELTRYANALNRGSYRIGHLPAVHTGLKYMLRRPSNRRIAPISAASRPSSCAGCRI
jgi:hypothetical protein